MLLNLWWIRNPCGAELADKVCCLEAKVESIVEQPGVDLIDSKLAQHRTQIEGLLGKLTQAITSQCLASTEEIVSSFSFSCPQQDF